MRAVLGVLADTCCVLVFVVIGRANHHAGESLPGVAGTAWPFLVGLAVGEVVTRAWRRPAALAPVGVGVWAATVGLGQVLRIVAGQGTKPAFVAVSAVFLGLSLLGWRWVASRIPVFRSRLAGLPLPSVGCHWRWHRPLDGGGRHRSQDLHARR